MKLTPQEKLKEIEKWGTVVSDGECYTCGMRGSEMHWLIARVKQLYEMLDLVEAYLDDSKFVGVSINPNSSLHSQIKEALSTDPLAAESEQP